MRGEARGGAAKGLVDEESGSVRASPLICACGGMKGACVCLCGGWGCGGVVGMLTDAHELVKCPLLDNPATAHDGNLVCVANRREAVSNNDARELARLGDAVESCLDRLLALGVQGGGGLIEQQHRCTHASGERAGRHEKNKAAEAAEAAEVAEAAKVANVGERWRCAFGGIARAARLEREHAPGFLMRLRAMAMRCFCPPDIFPPP